MYLEYILDNKLTQKLINQLKPNWRMLAKNLQDKLYFEGVLKSIDSSIWELYKASNAKALRRYNIYFLIRYFRRDASFSDRQM